MAEIAEKAKMIVENNGFANKISIIKGKVEEIKLPVEQVDIIISEWMGYFLLYESMLDTVLFARDKWLKVSEEGFMFPNKARLMVAGIEDEKFKEEKLEFWHNVYGFNMSCMREDAILEPLVD